MNTKKILCCRVHNGAEKDVIEFVTYDFDKNGNDINKSGWWTGLESSDTEKRIHSITKDSMFNTFKSAQVSFYITELEFDEEEQEEIEIEQINMFGIFNETKKTYALPPEFCRNELYAREELFNFYKYLKQRDYENAESQIRHLTNNLEFVLKECKKWEK